MLDSQVVVSFRQGLNALEHLRDFASMRDTINKMISVVAEEDLPYAYDAIARIIRIKQSIELQEVQGYPHAIQELDKKYQDLYLVLKTAKPKKFKNESSMDKQVSGIIESSGNMQNNPLGNLILDWVKSNKGNLVKGSAVVGTLGGAFWLYKFLTSEVESRLVDSETTFDKTIKSIQKYKAFSHMMKNPDMSDVEEFLSGKPVTKKRRVDRKIEKKPVEKDEEWDTDERSLMKDMDEAFGALSFRPNLEYKVPQLSTSKSVKPTEIFKENEENSPEKKEKRRVVEKNDKMIVLSKEKPSSSKTSPVKTILKSEEGGRLVPIIKRTKRVKKIAV